MPVLKSQTFPIAKGFRPILCSEPNKSRETNTAAHQQVEAVARVHTQLQTQLSELETSPAILQSSEEIERLARELAKWEDFRERIANRKPRLEALETTISNQLSRLELEKDASPDQYQITAAAELQIQEAAEKLIRLEADHSELLQKQNRDNNSLRVHLTRLETLPELDLSTLRETLAKADRLASDISELPQNRIERDNRLSALDDQNSRLPNAPTNVAETIALPIPLATTIRKHQSTLSELDQAITQEDAQGIDLEKSRTQFTEAIHQLQSSQAIPSLGDLRSKRKARDDAWQNIREYFKGGKAISDAAWNAHLELVTDSDRIADQLRTEAESVALIEEKRSQLSRLEQAYAQHEARATELVKAQKTWQSQWKKEWSTTQIKPLSPAEMLEWRSAWEDMVRNYDQLESRSRELEQVESGLEKITAELQSTLNQKGDFFQLQQIARQQIDTATQDAGERRGLRKEINQLETSIKERTSSAADLLSKVEDQKRRWATIAEANQLPPNIAPETGLELINERKQLFTLIDQREELRLELKQCDTFIQQYEESAQAKVTEFKIERDTLAASVHALSRSLDEAQTIERDRIRLNEEGKQASLQLTEVKDHADKAAREFEGILTQISLTEKESEKLDGVLAELARRDALQSRIDEMTNDLAGFARGDTVDQFTQKVLGEEASEIPGRIEKLEADQKAIRSELEEVESTRNDALSRLREMERVGDLAANHRQESEIIAAQIEADSQRFIRLELAIRFLESQIETYRRERQGPMLERSGDLLSQITNQQFLRLETDFDQKDQPILLAVRKDESRVKVPEMSEGTRDQLFLALRLAALEQHLETHEPMPLILDDLLMTFDDERAASIFKVFHQFAKTTQIFLFSHHRHLVDLAKKTLPAEGLMLHEL